MIRPCWLLLHRWRPTKVDGHAKACDFDLDYCATCGAYRMRIRFIMGQRGEHHALAVVEAHRFLMAVGHREREALFELWYDRNLDGAPIAPVEPKNFFGAPDSPLCCAAPDWELSLVEFARLGAFDVDLERCRNCCAYRLVTCWPKDSSDRARGQAARVSLEDAARLRAADWERRRDMLESKGWYGLDG